ncbi:hypothetical protein [Aurantiacibacter sp. D1-12]|uniref:hypothetical protein n=1 Tax=Aurantiacibacter sp. D1-12 TaxID=2993658 RepID=UPI00237CEA8E|nr:hypothetical protein [Aurantiacibacter sp. D1-12]MDE1467934.1 hypothetical protein [Aurantiacibacter sp. D1-12]
MRAAVANYGSLSSNDESIPDEHRLYAEKILKMDPLEDVQANVSGPGGARPMKLKASGLPSDLSAEVYRRLERMPTMPHEEREKHESNIVAEVLKERRGALRSITGVRPDSLPFHTEQANIAMQVRGLYEKRNSLQRDIDRVKDVRKSEDPETGEVVAEPIYWLSDTKRANFADQVVDIERQVRLLVNEDGTYGIEGLKRVRKALAESAAQLHRLDLQRAEEAEAKKRSAEINRDARINRRAEAYARMSRDEIK